MSKCIQSWKGFGDDQLGYCFRWIKFQTHIDGFSSCSVDDIRHRSGRRWLLRSVEDHTVSTISLVPPRAANSIPAPTPCLLIPSIALICKIAATSPGARDPVVKRAKPRAYHEAGETQLFRPRNSRYEKSWRGAARPDSSLPETFSSSRQATAPPQHEETSSANVGFPYQWHFSYLQCSDLSPYLPILRLISYSRNGSVQTHAPQRP